MPKQGKTQSSSNGSHKNSEDEDFFDEISSQLDSLKTPSEGPDPEDDVVELELGAIDPDPGKESPTDNASPAKPDSVKKQAAKEAPPTGRKRHRKAPIPAAPLKTEPPAKKSAVPESDSQKPPSERADTPTPKPPRKRHPTPEETQPDISETTDPVQSDPPEKGSRVDYDGFLAEVSADIDKFKGHFETADVELSDFVEYEMDEWILPEEEEKTETSTLEAPTPAGPEKKSSFPKSAETEKPPEVPRKPSPAESARKKPPKPTKSKASISAAEKPEPVSKKPLKQSPIPPKGKPKTKVRKTAKTPGKAKKKAPPSSGIKDQQKSREEIRVDRLVQAEPRRSPRRISSKFILGGMFTIVLLLAAVFLVMQDPFGFFMAKSDSTPIPQKTASSQADSSLAHRVPSPAPPSPAQKPVTAAKVEKTPATTSETPSPAALPKAEPAPAATMPASQPPQTERTEISVPQQQVKTETAPQTIPVEKEAPAVAKLETKAVPLPSPSPEPVPVDQQVKTFLNQWASAWEKTAGPGGDFTAYKACYAESFKARGMNKAAWIQDKQVKNSRKKWIAIALYDISISEQTFSNRITARFTQKYSSSNFSSTSPKTLFLAKEPTGWKIIGVGP
ncbi:hypothetical protein D3OALGA1CA_2760 [Olavius algarvensis associated proteobacterium Delta 3]|nr:hypothetical protein D3OALGB2SA_778 [Olavius algarvensis associated proteobacterium Delta 3]CAB5123864.1 hypothetical protein D3OALGA1CA_2760 [Olavius algarvensis associated proteobacterium Delta 3]